MYVKFCSDPEDFSGRATVIILIAQRGPKILKSLNFPGVQGYKPLSAMLKIL